MQNNNWSKTVLGVYRYLPRVSNAFDRLVKTRAYNSGFVSSTSSFNDVFSVTTAILDLTERKITLINLKLITEKALKMIDKNYAKLLIFKYIDGKKSNDIAEKFGYCIRTYFRKLNLALNSFSKALTRLGYTSDKLFKMLKTEKWILEVYNSYYKEDDKVENILENQEFKNKFKKHLMFEFKKVGVCFI